jgi:hypothetical protein
MPIHIIVNADGKILNRIDWDGVTPWSPPEGCTAHRTDCRPGDTWNHAFSVLVPNSDLDYLAAQAQEAAAGTAAAERERLLAQLDGGSATSAEVQAALAALLRLQA